MGDATRLKARILLASLPLVLGAGLLSAPGNRLLARISPRIQTSTNTALIFAVRHRDGQRARWLLNRGADVNWQNEQGISALDVAIGLDPADSEQMLTAFDGYWLNWNQFNKVERSTTFALLVTKRLYASDRNYALRCQKALEQGADANGRNWKVPTLFYVAERLDLKMTRLLLEHGARVDAVDSDKRNVLYWAFFAYNFYNCDGARDCARLRREAPETIALLLKAGANPLTPSLSGETPLQLAARTKDARPLLPLLRQYAAKFHSH